MKTWIVLGLSLGAMAFAGCGDDSGGGGGGGEDGSSATTTTGSSSDCIEVNDDAGGEACGGTTCEAGSYCNLNICDVGCESSSTCAKGEYCDLSTANEVKVGTCRAPGSNDTVCGASTSTTSTSSGGGDCQTRCYGKLVECGIPEDFDIDPVASCTDVCGRTTADEQDCIIAADCNALSDGNECGVILISSGTGG